MNSYLSRLPSHLTAVGDVSAGEIELREVAAGENSYGIVYEDPYILVIKDPVTFPGGRRGSYVRIVDQSQLKGGSGTVIVPIVDQHVVFVNLFRHATRQWEWELPRGYLDPGMTAEANAIKETHEEIGIEPEQVEMIGRVKPNTGLLSTDASVFVAHLPSDCRNQLKGQTEESIRDIAVVPFTEIDAFVIEHVQCGFSISGLFLTKAKGYFART